MKKSVKRNSRKNFTKSRPKKNYVLNIVLIILFILIALFVVKMIFNKTVLKSEDDMGFGTVGPADGEMGGGLEGQTDTLGDDCTLHADCGAYQQNGNGVWVFATCQRCSSLSHTCIAAGAGSTCEVEKDVNECNGNTAELNTYDLTCDNQGACTQKTNKQNQFSEDCTTNSLPDGADSQCNSWVCNQGCQILNSGDESSCTRSDGTMGTCVTGGGVEGTSTCE